VTGRERVAAAMRGGTLDRVPFMCQLSLGHYFLHSGLDPVDVWHDTHAFAEALLRLRSRYGFDGILVNLPGRDPRWRERVTGVVADGSARRVAWLDGRETIVPPHDNPRALLPDGGTPGLALDDVDPERCRYVEPHDIGGLRIHEEQLPPWRWDTLRLVRERAADVSVHGEVFSPFSQLLELVGPKQGLTALVDDADRVKACLRALCEGALEVMVGCARVGVDAVLISSAFAGGGFISRAHYQEFVLPFERGAIAGFKAAFPRTPVYTHTCGRIGDRLDLIEATGTDGIDTLDPPPLGDVDLAEAKRKVGGRLFLKGNIDPVQTVLRGSREECFAAARGRLEAAMEGGRYVLSTACSVPPAAPPENVAALFAAVEAFGWYDGRRTES
jgi:hypothetical protein